VSNVEKTLVEGTVIARETKIKNIWCLYVVL
jgi:hypothetical protein